jgi:hypothetical protein
VHTGFWWGDLGERHYLEDLGMDGRILLKRMWDGGMDRIDLTWDRKKRWAVVNTVMNIRVP